MPNNYLIIGATGALGFAVAKAVQASGGSATLLVRNRTSAIEKLGNLQGLSIVEGDVNDGQLLKALASGVKFIFHGANVSYEHWVKAMPLMTRSIIGAAEHAGATVIFPGNNYNYGQITQPISEITPFKPNTKVGKVRVELERMLQLATEQGRIRTLVVRMSEIWGPNVTNKQFAPIFENALKGKKLPWLICAKTPQQLLYNMDAGRAIVELTQCVDLAPYDVFNIGGTRVESMESWLKMVGETAGKPSRISILPKAMVYALGWFIPALKEVHSLAYKYETSVILNDERFNKQCPDFQQTPMKQAIGDTLQWFSKNGKESKSARASRKKSRLNTWIGFIVDNIAIGIFPVIITLAAARIPALENFAMYLAVAAGIYWTPGLHNLTNRFRRRTS